jgi:glycosyltransferase involved in cell wall biosynthesis
LARSLGCKVTEVGEKFITVIDEKLARDINERFVAEGEPAIVAVGNRLFDFAAARNYATSLATNDMICTLDADEAYSVLNIDEVNSLINQGFEQFEYQFIFAHDGYGRPSVQFVQSKFFDRRKVQWVGIVHEVLLGTAKRLLLAQNLILLEHWQQPGAEHRSNYIVGLALDCYQHPDKDRQSHYLARELLWSGRPKSALKEFERHVTMNGWLAERAQSMIFMGDCYGQLNNPEKQVELYQKAFYTDPERREALIKLARFYRSNNVPKMVIYYAKMSLDIPWTDYYANEKQMYEQEPHELLYWAYGWIGDVANAQKHLLICLDYLPDYPPYLRDTQYYWEYGSPNLNGWMQFQELTWLYETAKGMESVVELGSWKGKSTHALCSSKCPSVVAIDTWEGSVAEPDAHAEAKTEAVFDEFKSNVAGFTNLTMVRKDINEAVDNFGDQSVDMVFIDAGHTYEEVRNDIRKWKPKAKLILSGHDYCTGWPGVMQAVDEELGGPDEVHGTIWVKYLVKPKVSICIPTLGRPEKLHRLLESIKECAGYDNYEVVVKADEMPPNNAGAPKMLKKCVDASTGDLVMFLGNDCVMKPNFLREAVWEMARRFPELDGMVGMNDGYWKKEHVAPHWMASKKLLPYLDGEFFHTGYNHTGCDNELLARVEMIGKYSWAEKSQLFHDHPMMAGSKTGMDFFYEQAYAGPRHDADNKLYEERAKKYGFDKRVWA